MLRNPLRPNPTLCNWVRENAASPDWRFSDAQDSVFLGALAAGSGFGGRLAELAGRSVLVATDNQLAAAVALIELDGLARRLILCPADIAPRYLPAIVANAEVDAIVSDRAMPEHVALGIDLRVNCLPKVRPSEGVPSRPYQTEWVLLTSGTTGAPKEVVHTLASLTAAIKPRNNAEPPIVWATFYDIRRYGGLQIFLRAVLGGASFVLLDSREPIEKFLARLRAHAVTHVTGTPSHWRRVLWSAAAGSIAPRYIRMSGEIADQAILDNLRAGYPLAKIVHAYASTEAGVGFEVDDEREGFPAGFLSGQRNGVEIKIEGGTLRVRSAGTAVRYLGESGGQVAGEDGFVDTGDMIIVRSERCYFAGRTGGIINVGGLKVCPEEVESVINRHPKVRMSLVRSKKNPITGAVVVADVVLSHALDGEGEDIRKSEVTGEILQLCRERLAQYKTPVIISFVPSLKVTRSGKLQRHDA
jgi:acyl-coenzyme A synthetase/AMP-(fatty) acid ligase